MEELSSDNPVATKHLNIDELINIARYKYKFRESPRELKWSNLLLTTSLLHKFNKIQVFCDYGMCGFLCDFTDFQSHENSQQK